MQLRTVFFCSLLALPVLAACGDDTGGGTGGSDSTSTGSSTTAATGSPTGTTTGSATTGGQGGDPTGGGGDPTGGGGEGAGSPVLSCDTYCATIMEACDGNIQYPDEASCQAACATFQEGEYSDPDASLGCHQYHADAALADPGVHCGHAGPTGDDTCGTPCENFCQIAPGVCPDVFANEATCVKVCDSFEVGEFSVSPPATGDTLGCRMYHLTVAAQSESNAAIHCEHIAADSSQCN